MEYKVYVDDVSTKEQSDFVINVRKNTSLKTVALKGVKKHVFEYAVDPVDFMREVKSLHKEAYDLEDFLESLHQELELTVRLVDLYNYRFYNEHEDKYTTIYVEALKSFRNAWEDQLRETNGEQDFDKYLPPYAEIIEHGIELTSEESFLEDWVKERSRVKSVKGFALFLYKSINRKYIYET